MSTNNNKPAATAAAAAAKPKPKAKVKAKPGKLNMSKFKMGINLGGLKVGAVNPNLEKKRKEAESADVFLDNEATMRRATQYGGRRRRSSRKGRVVKLIDDDIQLESTESQFDQTTVTAPAVVSINANASENNNNNNNNNTNTNARHSNVLSDINEDTIMVPPMHPNINRNENHNESAIDANVNKNNKKTNETQNTNANAKKNECVVLNKAMDIPIPIPTPAPVNIGGQKRMSVSDVKNIFEKIERTKNLPASSTTGVLLSKEEVEEKLLMELENEHKFDAIPETHASSTNANTKTNANESATDVNPTTKATAKASNRKQSSELTYISKCKITIIGHSCVGKTSLKNAINGKKFQEVQFRTVKASATPTVHREYYSSMNSGQQIRKASKLYHEQKAQQNANDSETKQKNTNTNMNVDANVNVMTDEKASETEKNSSHSADTDADADADADEVIYNAEEELVIDYEFWDTPGQAILEYIPPLYITGAFAVFVVYDITDKHSFVRAKYWVHYLDENAKGYDNVVLIGNKYDLESKREVDSAMANQYANENDLFFVEISVKTKHNFDVLLAWMNETSVRKYHRTQKQKRRSSQQSRKRSKSSKNRNDSTMIIKDEEIINLDGMILAEKKASKKACCFG